MPGCSAPPFTPTWTEPWRIRSVANSEARPGEAVTISTRTEASSNSASTAPDTAHLRRFIVIGRTRARVGSQRFELELRPMASEGRGGFRSWSVAWLLGGARPRSYGAEQAPVKAQPENCQM